MSEFLNQESILTHGRFVRNLAYRLVRDDSRADDLVQKTWLTLLKHPMREETNPRAWLGRVVKNLARNDWRDQARRKKREQAVSRPETELVRSTADIAEAEETQKRLVQAVLGLDEPYRTAILLRYYDGYAPQKIADRLNIKVDSVKKRLVRGLEKLRKTLDGNYGGIRTAWLLALIPIAGLKATAKAAALGAPGAAVISSPASWLSATKLFLAAAAVAISAAAVWYFFLPDGAESDSPLQSLAQVKEDNPAGRSRPGGDFNSGRGTTATGEKTGRPATGSGIYFTGKVTDRITSEPIPSFDILLYQEGPTGWDNITVIDERVESSNGTFFFSLDQGGRHGLQVAAPGHLVFRSEGLEISPDTGLTDFTVPMELGLTLSGIVKDDLTGLPVAGALVTPEIPCTDLAGGTSNLGYDKIWDETDSSGEFVLGGFDPNRPSRRIAALHPDFTAEHVTVDVRAGHEIEIRLQAGFRIHGIVDDNDDVPIPGILVTTYEKGFPVGRPVITGPDGAYRTMPVHAGQVVVRTSAMAGDEPWWKVEAALRFTREKKSVLITDRDVELNFRCQPDQVVWTGIVYDADGSPVPGAGVFICPVEWDGTFGSPAISSAICDGAGSFKVRRLRPGGYQVNLAISRSTPEIFAGLVSFQGTGTHATNIQIPGGGISGIACFDAGGQPVSRGTVTASAKDSSYSFCSRNAVLNPLGEFSLQGLLPGSYYLVLSQESMIIDDYTHVDARGDPIIIEVIGSQIIENIVIEVPPAGTLLLKGNGYDLFDLDRIAFKLTCAANMIRGRVNTGFRLDGSFEFRMQIPPGTWILTATYEENGAPAVREFQIRDRETTGVVLNRDDF